MRQALMPDNKIHSNRLAQEQVMKLESSFQHYNLEDLEGRQPKPSARPWLPST